MQEVNRVFNRLMDKQGTINGTDCLSENSTRNCRICGREIAAMLIEVESLNIKRWIVPNCECEVETAKADLDRIINATAESNQRALFSISDLGEKYVNARFDNFEIRPGAEIAVKASRYYAENFDEFGPESLVLWGPPGNGKTMLAAIIHNQLVRKGKKVVFVSMPDLLAKIKATFNRNNPETEGQIMKAVIKADLLIIDDIGSDKTSDWVQEKLFQIIDGRYRRKLPIMATSNLNLKDLASHIGERAADRLTEMSQMIENKASSYRREIAKQRMSKFDEILK